MASASFEVAAFIVAVLATASSLVGILPLLLLLHLVGWYWAFGAASLVMAAMAARSRPKQRWDVPPVQELALAAAAAVFPLATLSALDIAAYWTTYIAVRSLEMIGSWFALALPLGPATAARGVAAAFLIIGFPSFSYMTADGLFRQLFPAGAGLRAVYHAIILTSRRNLLIGGAIVLFVAVFVSRWHAGAPWTYLVLETCLLAASPLWTAAEKGSRPHETSPVERALQRLLESMDLRVLPQPRTGLAGVDPMLLQADFLAYNDQRAFLIAVKVRVADRDSVGWTVGSSLISAAWALTDARESLEIKAPAIEPTLILVGHGPDPSLEALSSRQPIKLIHIADIEQLIAALRLNGAELRKTADSLLGELFSGAPTVAPAPTLDTSQPTEP